MIERKLAKCLTEYKRGDYSTVINKFNKFVTISQYSSIPMNVNETQLILNDKPDCGWGEILFGVDDNGNLIELMSIIDSSD